ncbi:hypothetical protein PINS_up001321 [Pythium insidiosum]|nr:hypothetical protein PINS_up001321 [Pythium insidiosum]
MTVLKMLETACMAVNSPDKAKRAEAEVVLDHFKRSPTAVEDSMALLSPTTPGVVLFYCVATIRESTLKRWALLTAAQKRQPLDGMMQFLWAHYGDVPSYVSGPMLQTIVLLMKRGWLERAPEEQLAVLRQIGSMMADNGGGTDAAAETRRRLIAAKWILAFVTEFSSASRSSAMAQPVEFHTKARKTLRKNGLKDLLGFAIQLLQDLIESTTRWSETTMQSLGASASSGGVLAVRKEQSELLETAFMLVVEMLNWDFADAMGNLAWSISSDLLPEEESRPTISPDDSWREVLVRPELIHSAFNTYAFFRNLESKNEQLLHLARQFLIQLASLRGPIFQNRKENVQFLSEIFRGTTELIHHPFLDLVSPQDHAAVELATREMIDLCQLLFRLIKNLGIQELLEHGPDGLLMTLLEELSSLSCKLLRSALDKIRAHLYAQTNEAVEDLWQLEGLDILLDSWVTLVSDPALDAAASSEQLSPTLLAVSGALSQFSAPVVQLYLEMQLELCAVNALADQDEDEDVEDNSAAGSHEQIELAAALARMNASSSAALLGKLLQSVLADIQQHLTALQGRNELTPALSQLYEKLHFLVDFSGLFLADEFTGERPCIPPRIHATFVMGVNESADVVNLLLFIMSQLLEFEAARVAQNPHSECLSPFVSEQLIRTITRLCATYLTPDAMTHATEVAPALLQVFGGHAGGRASELVNFLVQQCTVYLIHWPTQPVVMQNLMEFLLVLSRTRAINYVLGSAFWQSLVQANASAGTCLAARAGNGEPLLLATARIPSSLRGQLTEALCRAGMSSDDESMRRAHFEAIINPVAARLQRVISMPNFQSSDVVNDVLVQEEVKLIIELYSGVARSAEVRSHAMISSSALPVLPVMVKLFDLFHGDAQVVYLVLRFFCLFVEAQICYLTPKDALHVYTSCHELIRTYCRHHLGRKTTLSDEEDSYNDVLALLQLLSHLVNKEMIDFSDHSAEQNDVDNATVVVADVVFAGLSQVIPLMTQELLQYPSLSKQYFTLISFMIDVHADKLSALDDQLFSMLLQSLLVGIRHVDVDVARNSFQAIGELAGFHLKARQSGDAGLERHRMAHPEVFVHFIRVILRMALFEDFNPVILDVCAGALYPLILIEQERYYAVVEEIQNEQTDAIVRDRLLAAFRALMSFLQPEDIAMGTACTRKYRNLFKSNLFQFVATVRGFVQVK